MRRATSSGRATLEDAGVHVVYGIVGMKVHSKIALVVRREGDAIRRYVHLGTGNYNPVTARLYTDLGLLTCNEQIAADATHFFNALTGYSAKQEPQKLLVAPVQHAREAGGTDSPRNRAPESRAQRAPDFQDERARRSAHDPPALSGFAGGRESGSAGAGHLLPAPRRSRRQREHPRDQHRGAVPGTQPHLLLSKWRGGGSLSWAAPT